MTLITERIYCVHNRTPPKAQETKSNCPATAAMIHFSRPGRGGDQLCCPPVRLRKSLSSLFCSAAGMIQKIRALENIYMASRRGFEPLLQG